MKGEFEEEITPYFCGRDVCNVFEYSKYRDVLSHIEEDCKITLGELVVQGGRRPLWFKTTLHNKFLFKYETKWTTF